MQFGKFDYDDCWNDEFEIACVGAGLGGGCTNA